MRNIVGMGFQTERRELTMATAQAGLWVSDPQAYREKMYKLVGDRNPLDVLAQTAPALADIVRKHPGSLNSSPGRIS